MNPKRLITMFLALTLIAVMLSACGSSDAPDVSTSGAFQEGQELTEEQMEEMFKDEMFRPSEYVMLRAEVYEYPFMGMRFTLPENVMERMDRGDVAMLPYEDWTEEQEILYAFLSWNLMTDEQKNAEVSTIGTSYLDWEDSLERVAALGVYEKGLNLNEITGCTEHTMLGESADGAYEYYLSTNPDGDNALISDLDRIELTLIDMAPFQQISAFDIPYEESTGTSIGAFATEDVFGNTFSSEWFADYDLTMVNVFTTWCTPCVQEIPHLEDLYQSMKEQGIGVIGVVMDTVGANGETDDEGVSKAKLLAERTGASYPFLIPDSGNMNGKLNGITAYPTTFFVDKDGNIVGETHMGANDLEGWTAIVEETLKLVG